MGMKTKRFTVEQIIRISREAHAGIKVVDLCRTLKISNVTFYNWRSKYGGMEVSNVRRLKVLETENRQLKNLLADAMLENKSIKDVLAKKW